MAALDDVRFLMSETDPGKLGAAAAEVAFVGRSNCGKSTMINALTRRELARASATPGATRTINVYLTGGDRRIVDLPGYGYARGEAAELKGWGPMIETYLRKRPTLKAIFVLVDAKVGPTKLDTSMLDWLQGQGLPWRVIATKVDQVQASRSVIRRREVSSAVGVAPEALAWVSSKDNVGIKELRSEVIALLGLSGK